MTDWKERIIIKLINKNLESVNNNNLFEDSLNKIFQNFGVDRQMH